MSEIDIKTNAVLGDKDLQEGLKAIHPLWGDFVTRIAGEVWGMPLIDQKTKTFLALAVDIVNGDQSGQGTAFTPHIHMAVKQGATYDEIVELFVFMGAYAGLAKATPAFGALKILVENGAFSDKS